MSNQIFYNSTGTTPLEKAENNMAFYTLLIAEYSYANAENLFPAEQLHHLLLQLNQYRVVAPTSLISKIDATIIHYNILHKKLTNSNTIK